MTCIACYRRLNERLFLARSSRKGPPSAYKHPLTDDIGAVRTEFANKSRGTAPSTGGQPEEFRVRQNTPGKTMYCNRPLEASSPIPLELLHPVFGEFKDDRENCEPTVEDNALFLELTQAMSKQYDDEGRRGTAIRQVFANHGIYALETKIEGTRYGTDGDISWDNYRFVIFEIKNELGSTGCEPLFQAILYYLELTWRQAVKLQGSALPCLIIVIAG